MYSLLILLFYISISIARIESTETPASLCDNPVVHSADVLVNGSVRLYRDNYYWELNGVPDKEGFLMGPYNVWYPNFGPIHANTSVMTCIECNRMGFTFKFQGLKWWAWEPSGRQWKGGKDGEDFKYLTITADSNATGFNDVFHNGDPKNSIMIGISGKRVFYYSTKGYYIEPANDYDIKGYEGGKNGENFPADITAAFSWPPDEGVDGYQVFIFKEDKYCFRKQKLESGKQCDEWRDNKELFGCYRNGIKPKSRVTLKAVDENNGSEPLIPAVLETDAKFLPSEMNIRNEASITSGHKSGVSDSSSGQSLGSENVTPSEQTTIKKGSGSSTLNPKKLGIIFTLFAFVWLKLCF